LAARQAIATAGIPSGIERGIARRRSADPVFADDLAAWLDRLLRGRFCDGRLDFSDVAVNAYFASVAVDVWRRHPQERPTNRCIWWIGSNWRPTISSLASAPHPRPCARAA
jgi:hypothetical protein